MNTILQANCTENAHFDTEPFYKEKIDCLEKSNKITNFLRIPCLINNEKRCSNNMQQIFGEKEIELADKIKMYMDKANTVQEITDIVIQNFDVNYPRNELSVLIDKFIEAKYLVPGFTFTKKDILDNQKRKEILQYIAKNPGSHGRAIRKNLKLGANEFFWHIPLLEAYGLIKRCDSDGLEGFLLNRSYQDYEAALVWYQHPRSHKILKICGKVPMSALEVSKTTKMHYTTVKKYIEKLTQFDILQERIEKNVKKYLTNNEFISKLRKIINSAYFDDFISD